MEQETRRISLVIREDQYQQMSKSDVNVSGLIRDLIDDHYSAHTIALHVSKETHDLYTRIVSEAPRGDLDIELYFRAALRDMLSDKIKEMENLQKKT